MDEQATLVGQANSRADRHVMRMLEASPIPLMPYANPGNRGIPTRYWVKCVRHIFQLGRILNHLVHKVKGETIFKYPNKCLAGVGWERRYVDRWVVAT